MPVTPLKLWPLISLNISTFTLAIIKGIDMVRFIGLQNWKQYNNFQMYLAEFFFNLKNNTGMF